MARERARRLPSMSPSASNVVEGHMACEAAVASPLDGGKRIGNDLDATRLAQATSMPGSSATPRNQAIDRCPELRVSALWVDGQGRVILDGTGTRASGVAIGPHQRTRDAFA
jgi:hypothetical protein